MTCYTITIFPEQGKPCKYIRRTYKTEAGANRRARALSMENASVMVQRTDRDDDYPEEFYIYSTLYTWEHGAIVRDYSTKSAVVGEARERRDRLLRIYDRARKDRIHAEEYARKHGVYALKGDVLDEMRKYEEAVRLAYLEARDMFNAVVSA